jgi:hypothetical protein
VCYTSIAVTVLASPDDSTSADAGGERMKPPVVVQSWPSVAMYEAANPSAKKVADLPIRTDLKEAIGLCVGALTNSFDRDRDDEPYFYGACRADGYGEFRHAVNIGIPHVVGRALWGAMLAEETAEITFPEEALSTYARYCMISFDNEDNLNSYIENGNRLIEFHNMREGLFGLVALMRGRQNRWAKEKAHEMILTLEKLTDSQGHWTVERATEIGMGDRVRGIGKDATTSGRIVGPLLQYYQFSKDPLALKLAKAYAQATLDSGFLPDGRIAPMEQSGGHIHSVTSSLSGITALAMYINDTAMLDRCRQIMEHGIPEYHCSWGWGDEVTPEHSANEIARGEINQTGDVIRTALLLGQAGEPKYYELAERYVRSMLLPTQHTNEEMKGYVRDQPNPKSDAERDVRQRVAGGYAMQLPNDRMDEGDWPLSTLDITSGATHAFCEFYRHRVTTNDDTAKVNLLFDYEGDDLTLACSLPKQGDIKFEMHAPKKLLVRIPTWVDVKSLQLVVDGKRKETNNEGGYLDIGHLESGTKGQIRFDVPVRVEKETVDGTEYTVTWAGSQVIEILPRGKISPIPF